MSKNVNAVRGFVIETSVRRVGLFRDVDECNVVFAALIIGIGTTEQLISNVVDLLNHKLGLSLCHDSG